MRKVLKTVLVASIVASSLASCSAYSDVTKSPSKSASASHSVASAVASAVASHVPSHAPSAASTATTKAPASTATASGTHAVSVGLGAEGNTQVQSQPAPGTCHVGTASNGQPLPDPNCTPGTTNPAVTQDNLSSTICRSGYTKSIRPTSSITGREKKANAASYGYTGALGNTEYDHLISLELGGSPNDPKNLWVEPGGPDWKPSDKFRNDKDDVENKMNALICSHKVSLADAQSAIANDWTTALSKVGG